MGYRRICDETLRTKQYAVAVQSLRFRIKKHCGWLALYLYLELKSCENFEEGCKVCFKGGVMELVWFP